ncbi:hypothetical protein ABQE93_24365 [Mycolicibacterium sp. XJ662]
MAKARTKTSLRERVLDEVPGYRQAQRRHLRLTELFQIVGTPLNELNRGYIDRICAAADDETVSSLDDLAGAYATDWQQHSGRLEFFRLVGAERDRAADHTKTAMAQGADSALEFLRGELKALVADIVENRETVNAHPNSAAKVLASDAGAADRWHLVTVLISRYEEIRTEHRRYVNLQQGEHIQGYATVGQCARFLEVDPYWRHQRATTPGHASTDPAIAAWFNNRPRRGQNTGNTGIWPVGYSQSQWLLIVADSEPWLPDADTIDHAHRLAEQLFLGRKTYNRPAEVKEFYRLVTELRNLGAVVDVAAPHDQASTVAAPTESKNWRRRHLAAFNTAEV